MSELYDILVETPPTKVILLALDQGLWDCERSLAELAALCEANHMEAVAEVTQKRQTPETGIVLGSGKLEEAAAAAAELGAKCAVFDGELTGSQIRNISTALGGLEVIDRTMLILEIFRSRAVTNEGKLQTELALLRYRLPRLQGMGESLSRQGGGGGAAVVPAVVPVRPSWSWTAATSTPASTHWLRNWPRWKSAGARAGKPAPRPECRWSASWATPMWANPA